MDTAVVFGPSLRCFEIRSQFSPELLSPIVKRCLIEQVLHDQLAMCLEPFNLFIRKHHVPRSILIVSGLYGYASIYSQFSAHDYPRATASIPSNSRSNSEVWL